MPGKPNVLAAYRTKSGSTAGIAKIIAEVLRDQGASVDVREAGSSGRSRATTPS
jgi:menaquinone-dependent protoporphyrinogen IX oxidase